MRETEIPAIAELANVLPPMLSRNVDKNRGGCDIDIQRICKQAAAELALELVLQAELLAHKP